jgi:phage-related protein
MSEAQALKPIIWIGSSRKDFGEFPDPVKDRMGYFLYVAQQGGKHSNAKIPKGFGGAGLVEIVRDFRGDTFRAVNTVRLAGKVYVLHAFQKKSRTGNATPKAEVDLIKKRLAEAEQLTAETKP